MVEMKVNRGRESTKSIGSGSWCGKEGLNPE
jgi:hypothetical protein